MKEDVARGFFTSDLSVNEFLLVKESGFEPVGLVLGSSIYHIGFQQAMWNQNQEMAVLTQAMYHARELAMTRMEEEADQLGADGIVGVRLEIGRYDWGADLAEFIAVGHRRQPPRRRPAPRSQRAPVHLGPERPGLLDAAARRLPAGRPGDGQLRLPRRASGDAARRCKQIGRNVEMPNFTQALYEARELAMERMQNEADEAQAEGIVGARIIERSHGWGSHVIEFFAIGTAVISICDDHAIEPPGAGAAALRAESAARRRLPADARRRDQGAASTGTSARPSTSPASTRARARDEPEAHIYELVRTCNRLSRADHVPRAGDRVRERARRGR